MIRSYILHVLLLMLLTLPTLSGANPVVGKKKCAKGTKKPSSKGTKKPTSKGTKSPLQKKTKVPTSKGMNSPSKGLNACGTVQPSTSPQPSTSASPSSKPSQTPSVQPSFAPSISHVPSVSNKPSVSTSPSFSPSKSFSSWCDAYSNGNAVPTIGEAVNGTYFYEMVYDSGENLETILQRLDEAILNLLFEKFVRCPKEIRSRYLQSNSKQKYSMIGAVMKTSEKSSLRSLLIDSMDLKDQDSVVNDACSELTATAGSVCKTFEGEYTLYVRETMNRADAQIRTLRFLRDNMDNGTIATQVEGVDAMRFLTELNGSEITNPEFLGFAQPIAAAALSGAGIMLITTGAIVALLFVFAAARRREHYKVERMEEVFEEEESLFDKGIGLDGLEDNETDLMSTNSWKQNRNVRILGDEDSDDGNGLRGRNGLGRRGDDAINVHKCTSATCQLCSHERIVDPMFIKSIYPDNGKMSDTRHYSTPDTIYL